MRPIAGGARRAPDHHPSFPRPLTDRTLTAGLFDVVKERARLGKQREKLAKDLAGVAARVANQAFMSKAPPHVVAEARALCRTPVGTVSM